jgi:lipopolysaccharide export system permease protein
MKKLDWLVIKSFIGPFALTFAISLFVLDMQFLWKYVDDLVGKGLSTWVLTELMFYASAKLVPLALPLAVLLASIMTYGSFGEHFELTAIKSAGVSLLRFMKPLIIGVTVISAFAFYFSNNILPMANLKFGALLYDIRHQKPLMAIKPGIFYSGIDGYFIKAGSKDEEKNALYDLVVYDHTSGKGNDHVIMAKKGAMIQDEQALALTLKLENGNQYKEVDKQEPESKRQMVHTTFRTWEKKFDMSQFKLNRTDENFFKDLKQMLTLGQLQDQIDTINIEVGKLLVSFTDYVRPYYNYRKFNLDSTLQKPVNTPAFAVPEDLVRGTDKATRINIMERAMTRVRNVKNYADITVKQLEYRNGDYVLHVVEVYRKFTLSIACIVLFFIGAPLGSIIRKGGLGWPLFYAVLFFILYHVSSMIGEKLAEKDVLTPFAGMWLSTFVLLPIGLFLTIKAAADSRIYSTELYFSFFKKMFSKKVKVAH